MGENDISENNSPLVRWHLLIGILFCLCGAIQGRSAEPDEAGAVNESSVDVGTEFLIKPAANLINPTFKVEAKRPRVNWTGVLTQSLEFLAVEHAFRLATEKGTREGMSQIPRGYLNAVSNLHGWSDGDPFYVNYVGHPMQGAIAGYIWAQNDTRYLHVEFGRNSDYWKSRLRATAFSWVYSEQFEIGPLSEASIGGIQALYPQQGFVDHVVTPIIGLGWMIAEDSLDKYVVKFLEARTSNRFLRTVARGGLNPSRTFTNVLAGKAPWYRPTDPETLAFGRSLKPSKPSKAAPVAPPRGVAPFEFSAITSFRTFAGSSARGSCPGGGASGAFRVAATWQLAFEVDGCRLNGLPNNFSGDILSYLIGPRWVPQASGRWSPYAQVLIGGRKVTQEQIFPDKQRALTLIAEKKDLPPPNHEDYTRESESSGLSVAAGAGLDLKLNDAVAVRLAKLDYAHSWVSNFGTVNYANDVNFTTGIVIRLGTW